MPRLTISLSEDRQRAVKETAARRGITITALIDECLERAGVRTSESARQILSRARAKAQMRDAAAMDLALREISAVRAQHP